MDINEAVENSQKRIQEILSKLDPEMREKVQAEVNKRMEELNVEMAKFNKMRDEYKENK